MPRLTEEGKYEVEVIDAHLIEAKTGSIGVWWDFSCEEGTIEYEMWVTEKTVERSWDTLALLGFTKEHAENLDNLDNVGQITRGRRCEIVCKDEEYKGEVKLKVSFVNRLGGRATAATKGRLHQLLTGNSITRLAGPVSAPRSSRPASEMPPSAPIDDSSVPY